MVPLDNKKDGTIVLLVKWYHKIVYSILYWVTLLIVYSSFNPIKIKKVPLDTYLFSEPVPCCYVPKC